MGLRWVFQSTEEPHGLFLRDRGGWQDNGNLPSLCNIFCSTIKLFVCFCHICWYVSFGYSLNRLLCTVSIVHDLAATSILFLFVWCLSISLSWESSSGSPSVPIWSNTMLCFEVYITAFKRWSPGYHSNELKKTNSWTDGLHVKVPTKTSVHYTSSFWNGNISFGIKLL